MRVSFKYFTIILSVIIISAIAFFIFSSLREDYYSKLYYSETKATKRSKNAVTPKFHLQLALRWAPILYQNVKLKGYDGLGGKADYISKLDFDDDWDMQNNWENAAKFSQVSYKAYAYYSVVTTSTHWFIVYGFFHPRDWSQIPILNLLGVDTHENDFEGALLVIKRPQNTKNDPYGKLLAMFTVFHGYLLPFALKESSLKPLRKSMPLFKLQKYRNDLHPVIIQETGGHGIKAWPHIQEEENIVIYYPDAHKAEEPKHPNDRHVTYMLIDIFKKDGLWARRNDPETFAYWGSFAGDNEGGAGILATKNAAKTPWGWGDKDSNLQAGVMATDPVKLLKHYFTGFSALSETYIINQYRQ